MSVRILNADCLTALPQLAAEGFRAHAVVTDPPYGLEFMGAEWDTFSDKPRRVPGTGGREAPFAHHAVALTGKRNGNYQAWCEQWAREVYACMLPGAHLAAFGGTRTWHRMAVAIEDAGFEIRDTLMFLHGVGFPKSHNVNKAIGADNCCQCHKSNVSCPSAKERPSHHQDLPRVREGLDTSGSIQSGSEQGLFSGVRECVALGAEKGADNSNSRPGGNGGDHLRDVRQEDLQAEGLGQEKRPDLLQQLVSQQDIRGAVSANRTSRAGRLDGADASLSEPEDDRSDEPGMEGRGDISEAPRELRERPVCEMPAGVSEHGSDGRLRDGASAGDGAMDRAPAQPNGVRASSRPQSAKQPAQQSRPVAVQPEPQVGGAWAHCSRCGKPRIPDGIGSALKPAFEPIILARKPLESNLAANTLKHGCGGLNIDACRVGTDVISTHSRGANGAFPKRPGETSAEESGRTADQRSGLNHSERTGRWPANVLHDGSPEVEEAFARFGERTTNGRNEWRGTGSKFGDVYGGALGNSSAAQPTDTGSASRFFYSCKADASDRAGSRHPTVKPTALMRWLVQLVCPPGGTVLDPFAGTGSTGLAADQLGMNAVLIERDPTYAADARRKITSDAPLFTEVA